MEMEHWQNFSSSTFLYEDLDINGTVCDNVLSDNLICHYDLVFIPLDVSRKARGYIKCNSVGILKQYSYEIETSGQKVRLLKAVKNSNNTYKIYSEIGSENFAIGSLKKKFFKNQLSLYKDSEKVLVIEYRYQIFDMKAPKKFKVINTKAYPNSYSNSGHKVLYHNTFLSKTPLYSVNTNSYMLNFNNSEVLPSSKNFQLIHPHEPNYISISLGKLSQDTYLVEHSYPWCAYQAFAIGLSSILY